ncbi:MAG: MFS transporter [Lautropia sp.]
MRMPTVSTGPALTLLLGVSQLVCWGISYYLVGVFGERIADDFGWARTAVHAGFSLALLVMGLGSGWAGRLVDRFGGRGVMMAGSALLALACVLLASSREAWGFSLAWAVMGVAMRLTLYDAAFATLVRLLGPGARRPIAQITLLGGLASTVFWPVGHALAESIGWRGAVFVYAAIALATVALHAVIPAISPAPQTPSPLPSPAQATAPTPAEPPAATAQDAPPRVEVDRLDAALFAAIFAIASFLNAAMSAHMIGLLAGVGVSAAAAVWVSALRGIGQSLARLAEVLFGARVEPLSLNLGASALLVAGFVIGPLGLWSLPAALGFAFFYGAGNGLLTITRGTVPLALFSAAGYGARVGRLLAPGFYLAAGAPLVFAWIMDGGGERAALWFACAMGVLVVVGAALLRRRHRPAAPAIADRVR